MARGQNERWTTLRLQLTCCQTHRKVIDYLGLLCLDHKIRAFEHDYGGCTFNITSWRWWLSHWSEICFIWYLGFTWATCQWCCGNKMSQHIDSVKAHKSDNIAVLFLFRCWSYLVSLSGFTFWGSTIIHKAKSTDRSGVGYFALVKMAIHGFCIT